MDTVDKNESKKNSSQTKRGARNGRIRDDDVEENSFRPPTRGSSRTNNRSIETATATTKSLSPHENAARVAASVDPRRHFKARLRDKSFASSSVSWMGWKEAQAQQLQTDGENDARVAGTPHGVARFQKNGCASFAMAKVSAESKHTTVHPLGAERQGHLATNASPMICPDLQENSNVHSAEEQSAEITAIKASANRDKHSTSSGPPLLEMHGVSATTDGAFAPQGQRLDTAPTECISSVPPEEEEAVLSYNKRPQTVLTAVVETKDDYEARIRRDVEARLHSEVQAEVQRILQQSAVTAENVVALDVREGVPADGEANEEILDDGVDGQEETHRKLCKRSSAMFVCVLLVVFVALAVGLTAAILHRNKDKTASSATTGSGVGPFSSSPTHSPVPATIAPTESPTDTPTDPPTDPPTDYPTDPPTPVPTVLADGPWQQLGQDIVGKFDGEQLGSSVSLSKDASVMAIGGPGYKNSTSIPGYVRIYEYDSATATWQQLGQELVGESDFDEFGISVALNDIGDVVAIGAKQYFSNRSGPGYVRVYQYNSATVSWQQKGQEVTGDSTFDEFGFSVSLSGEGVFLAVGAVVSDKGGANSGHAGVYKYDTATSEWQQLGQDMIGNAAGDQFGHSISLNSEGNVVAIGATQWRGNDDESDTGYVHVYNFITASSEWTQMGQELLGGSNGDEFGISVSISAAGDILAVGAESTDDNGSESGRVYVYQFSAATSSWNQLGQNLDGEESLDFFGGSVSLSGAGNVLAVGALFGANGNGVYSGHVHVYMYGMTSLSWQQVDENIGGEADGDWSGYSVSLSGNGTSVAIGAPHNDDSGEDSGHARVYTLN